ncbi:vitamin K epoxide reductase family protein [Roseibacillus persicicus]|uniref:Vitamin K epoxide reductase domain-containing protein n=1 Tax=Roseibacillus persicicus TaxID=454148 RepID=A0A918WMV1_9BACT|nr:vitamin K epoxide reductase family protein [Roseibacillus persicicus]GHC57847.1 hypothetical protein GCM10007100_25880 [Roseibacillus persicicus]
MNTRGKLVVRILAGIGALLSLYLLTMKLNGQISSISGCGSGGGCANVLGSRWSQFFGIPVSAFSSALYLTILGLTFRFNATLARSASILLFGAAAWFMGLQFFYLKTFCPWCLATHLTGILTATALLLHHGDEKKKSSIHQWTVGLGGIAILVAGQLFGPVPDTHLITEEKQPSEPKETSQAETGERMVSFPNSETAVPLKDLPHIGPIDAPHVLIKYFDYTCNSCRDMHGDLGKLQASYPEEITVVYLPVPLNRSCNPHLSSRVKDHEGACELARLSLAVWKTNPELWEQVHNGLFSRPVLSPAIARGHIEQRVDKVQLEEALKDPWIAERLTSNMKTYQTMVIATDRMPKLVMEGGSVMHGISRTTEDFVKTIREKLKL